MKIVQKFATLLFIAITAFLQVACQSSDGAALNTTFHSSTDSLANTALNNTPAECSGESLAVLNFAPYHDNNNHWWLIGQVQNRQSEDVPFTTLCITLEAPGQDQKTELWLLDTTVRNGETAPFRALINSPRVSSKTRFTVTAHAADPKMTLSLQNDLLGYREIKSSNVKVLPNQAGLQFTGNLINIGKNNANNIRVIIAIFDSANHLVGVADGNAPALSDVEDLKPGAEVAFTASTSYLTGPMERYEIAIIEGRSIEAVRGFQP